MKAISKTFKYNKYNLLKLSDIQLFLCKANLKRTAITKKYYYDFGYVNSEEFHKFQDPFYSSKIQKNLSSNYSNTLISFKEISQTNKYLMVKAPFSSEILVLSKDVLVDNVISNWENFSEIYFFKRYFKRGLIKYKKKGGYNVFFFESFNSHFLPKSHSKIHYNFSGNTKKYLKSKVKINFFLLSKTTYNFEVLSVFKSKRKRWIHFRQNLANKKFFNYNLNNVVSLKKVPYNNLEQKLFLQTKFNSNKIILKRKQLLKFNSEMFASKIIRRNSSFD
jgi:hypothetical protein